MANIDSKILDEYLVQVRRIAESREKGAEKQILKLYNELVSDLNGFLGNEYVKYAEDDRLTYEILRRKGEYARFLEEVNKRVDSIIPEVKTAVDELINDTYEKCYNGMVEGVKKSTTAEALRNEFKSVKAVRPEVIKAAVQNPIPKLRLTPTLERNRKSVIREIKREIGVGLSQGDRMSTMARRLVNRVNINYRQSMLIARTEAHRVRETGLNDAANEVDEVLKANGSEYRKIKIWNTCEDASVRDTHAKMNGVAVLQDEKFELPSGATADCPGTSGVAAEDCNCRCFLTHDIVTDSEFYALTGRHFPDYEKKSENQLTDDTESDTIETEDEENQSLPTDIVDGKNLVGELDYSASDLSDYDYAIEKVVHAQGYDGAPMIVNSEEEFAECIEKDHFIAERTIHASNDDELKKYVNQLKCQNGESQFYVNCAAGGAQYGQGMYCAADYSKGTILKEAFTHEIEQYGKGECSATIWMTLEPSAKILDLPSGKKAAEYITDMYRNAYMEKFAAKEQLEQVKQYINVSTQISNLTLHESETFIDSLYEQQSNARAGLEELIKGASDAMLDVTDGRKYHGIKDPGALAAEMGYDAINAIGHGATESYTVVLNRTKLIIYGGENYEYIPK